MSPSTPSSSTSAGPRLTTVPMFIRAACENCRTRKLKCSGQPTDTAMQEANLAVGGPEAMLKCARCAKENTECVFASRAPIGRPKKRKSEDGSDLPGSALASADTSIDPSSNGVAGPSSSTPQPRAPSRKRTKKDASTGAKGASAPRRRYNPLHTTRNYNPSRTELGEPYEPSEHAELVANAAAAAAAAIAMGASRVNYDDDHSHQHHHDAASSAPPPPPPTLPRFNDVSSPAAAASTLLDFRYQQQPTTSSSSQAPSAHANGRPSSSVNPTSSAVAAAAAAAAALVAADARNPETTIPTMTSSAPAPYPSNSANGSGSGPTMSQLIDAEDRQYRQNHMNGADLSLKQERDRDPLHASSSEHPQYNSSANDNSDPFYDGGSEEGSLLPGTDVSLDKSQSHSARQPTGPSSSQSLSVEQDFRGRPQQGLHRIPRAPEFDPGPVPHNRNANVIYGAQRNARQQPQQQHQTPRPFSFHPHYLTPENTPSMSIQSLASAPSQPATPSESVPWWSSVDHRQTQPRQQPPYQPFVPSAILTHNMPVYNQSMSASNSYSSLPPTTPATEFSTPAEALAGVVAGGGAPAPITGSHPTFTSQSLADFLSSLDTLSLTASDGLTPAMLDSSSLHGTFGSLAPIQDFTDMPAVPNANSEVHAQSQHNVVPVQHQQVQYEHPANHRVHHRPQNLVLGSALFTDLSQKAPQAGASVSAKDGAKQSAEGGWIDATRAQNSNALQNMLQVPTLAGDGALSLPTQGILGQQGDATIHQNRQQQAGVAVTATTEELAGLSYAVPADFSWWDDFFSKGPFIPHATNATSRTNQGTQTIQSEAAKIPLTGSASALQTGSEEGDRAHREQATTTTRKSCCQPQAGTKHQAIEVDSRTEPVQAAVPSCCSSKASQSKAASVSTSQESARTTPTLTNVAASSSADASSHAEVSEKSGSASAGTSTGKVHCVPDPKGEGCTCLCNAEVALLSVRRVLQRTEAIPLGEVNSDSSPRIGESASNAVATTLHLTLSASQAVSAQCACSADCPTCREDNNVWGSAGKQKQRQRQLSQPETSSDGASPRIVSASLLVSTALQIYARAVKMLRETLTSAAPPQLLGSQEKAGPSAMEVGREGKAQPDAWSCAHPGHSRFPASASTQASQSSVAKKQVAFPNIAPPDSPPISCCGASASMENPASPSPQQKQLTQDPAQQVSEVAAVGGVSSQGLDIDIKIGSTYRPLPHNARRIALFAMKLELRDLQEALRKVAVLAQADGVVVGGWPSSSGAAAAEEEGAKQSGDDKGKQRQRTASTNLALAPMLNPIDRMVITKLHVQLGELLNTVESLE
ncbi:hypothetical protein OC861_004111 [Tilletia horrida]|nr:hypothetical protein OC861_004111 [Tilletia horrida]